VWTALLQLYMRTRVASASPISGQHLLPVLLTADEAAALLRLTRKAFYALVARGHLDRAVVRIGRLLRIDQGALLELLQERGVPSPQGAGR
jgi:excisionase family DNA binding protein